MGRRIGILNLVNYKDHPTDNRYKVFNFNSKAEADYFEDLLKEKRIWFEKDVEKVQDKTLLNPSNPNLVDMYLFGVKQRDFEKVQKLNYLVSAKYRPPTFKNKFLRYTLLFFLIIVIVLASLSYMMNQQ
jgi:hypothetical protein